MKKSTIVIFAVTAALLLVPLVAMQFTDEVAWSPSDFVVMGALLLFTGFTLVFATSKAHKVKYKIAIGAAILLAFLAIWVHLAVGIVDTWPLAGS